MSVVVGVSDERVGQGVVVLASVVKPVLVGVHDKRVSSQADLGAVVESVGVGVGHLRVRLLDFGTAKQAVHVSVGHRVTGEATPDASRGAWSTTVRAATVPVAADTA